jgi:hypothetical protein
MNIAGTKPGDAGLFNCFFPFGVGKVTKTCSGLSCGAVHLGAHLTASSSVYIENTWATDDGGFGGTTNGAGFFIESQGGTWILGLGSGKHSKIVQDA